MYTRKTTKLPTVADRALVTDMMVAQYADIIQEMVRGKVSAERAAGYLGVEAPPSKLTGHPAFREAVRKARQRWEEASDITRRDIATGLEEAINLAMVTGDAGSAVRGWAEIGKLVGAYAPQRTEIKADISGTVTHKKLEALTDAELAELAYAQNGGYDCEAVTPPQMLKGPIPVTERSALLSTMMPRPADALDKRQPIVIDQEADHDPADPGAS